MKSLRKWLILSSVVLAFGVILLGAYTRLVDAGLGCPDWPGCYGLWRVPLSVEEITKAETLYPKSPVDSAKAHTEMAHRYLASSLGLLIVMITGLTLFNKKQNIATKQKFLALALTALVIFQGLLGMWTVTLKLLPIIVMAHLLGGLLTLSLLWCLYNCQTTHKHTLSVPPGLKRLALFTLTILGIQIALGGWTSTNYAALICPDFPTCQGTWWPEMSLQGLNFWGAFKFENPLTFMTLEGRTLIQMLHRFGALITTLFISFLSYQLWVSQKKQLGIIQKKTKIFLSLILGLLTLQVILGITNVLALLPLSIAVAHNGVATLLLLTLISLQFYLRSKGDMHAI